jgi:hypothetical protein
MSRRRIVFLVGLFGIPAVACQNIAGPQAFNLTVADTVRASALNGTPVGSRSALDVWSHDVFAPDGSLTFDLAFDIDNNGKAVLIPVSKVALCSRVCQVGLQIVTDSTFDQLRKARARGYTYDTPITVDVGQPVLIVAKSFQCQSDLYSNDLYAKMVVDSVRTSDRSIFFRIVTDPNCGFQSLVPGETPKH